MSEESKTFIRATSTLVGTIIGVGFFGVPYVIDKAGVFTGIFYFLFLGIIVTLVHLMYGDVVLRTKEKHRFVGFVEKYLGKKFKNFAIITSTLGFWSAITAYIIIGGEFLFFLLSPIFGGNHLLYQIVFFIVLAILVYFGIRLVTKAETFLTALLVLLILILIGFALPHANFARATLFDLKNVFLPYGIILFALSGAPAIPEICEILKGASQKRIQASIVLGTITAVLLTAIFAFAVIGVTTENIVNHSSIKILSTALGDWVILIGSAIGLLAIATSFLVLGVNLKEQFIYDLHKNKILSFFLAVCIPFLIFLLLTRDFIKIIGFAGAVFTALDSALLVAVWRKTKRVSGNKEGRLNIRISVSWVIICLFILGALYEILHNL